MKRAFHDEAPSAWSAFDPLQRLTKENLAWDKLLTAGKIVDRAKVDP